MSVILQQAPVDDSVFQFNNKSYSKLKKYS